MVLAGKVAVRPIELTAAAIGRIVDALMGLIEKAGYAIAFGAGVVHGFFKAIWDAVSGIAKLIYEVLKSIFSLDLVSDLEKIIGALKKLTLSRSSKCSANGPLAGPKSCIPPTRSSPGTRMAI